ncbi:hypothetical protein J7337_007799 [Fusarium musae]|uniref:Uncharacterized protein n=1 Tax=Fusarium musae TaxID=1042133 RepID=A0A9P8DHP9_9HYPO|nr:hypothetical protein J7337_007799 [Fusarium musae]KAG9502083.1 hypothetical protein J7337_007799 [Fusarium musae]
MVRNWYQPDGFDAKDKPYVYSGPPKDRNALTSISLLASDSVALKRYTTPTEIPVLDAVCAAFRFLAFSGDNRHLVTEPSRRFIYYNARAVTKMPVGIREALRAVNLYGACLESKFPWVIEEDFDYGFDVSWAINERPSDITYDEASHGPLLEPYRLDHYPSEEVNMLEDHELAVLGALTLSKVRLCIAEGYPVIFAFHLFWDSFKFVKAAQSGDQGYPTIEMIPRARRLAGPQKEHTTQAALIVAFDHIKRRVLVQSMMESISFFWMPYEWIINFRATESFWMLRNSGIRGQGRPVMEKASNDTWRKWEEIGLWTLERVPKSSAVSQAPNSSIALVSRKEGHLDMFWISEQCTVERSYRYPSDGKWQQETVPIKSEETPLPGAIVAVSAHEDKLDIFWMTKNGAVCNGSWQQVEPKWYTRRILQEQDGIAEPRAGLAATIGRRNTPFEDIINVYCVGPDGSIKHISTTRSWTGTDTATLLSGPGTAYRCTSLSAVVDGDHRGVDSSARLIEVVVWIAADGSIDGKMIARSNQWVDIWAKKGPANVARLSSRISAVHYGYQNDRFMSVHFAAPDGKMKKDYAIISADGDPTHGKLGHRNESLNLTKQPSSRPDSDIKALGWNDMGEWDDVVLWQDEDSKMFLCYWGLIPRQLFDSNGVRRGSPFGLSVYGGKLVMAMKLDDGLIGVGYCGRWKSFDGV